MAMLKCRWLITIIFLFALDGHIYALEADDKCPEGQKRSACNSRKCNCEDCPSGQYQPYRSDSPTCKVCTKCNGDKFSMVIRECNKTIDTKCQCRPGFVHRDNNFATCKCNKGYGLTTIGGIKECHKCEHGFFTENMNSICVKWNECKKSGIKVNGTKITDAICNKDLDENSNMHLPTMPVTSPLAHNKPLTEVATKKCISLPEITTKSNGHAIPTVIHNKTGKISLMVVGIVGLLVLAAVTCKLNIIPCIKDSNLIKEQKKGSVCRRPVEESGDSSRSSLVKPTPVEP